MTLTVVPDTEISPSRRVMAPEFLVMHGALRVGRICKRDGAPAPGCQWIWAITGAYDGPDAMRRSGLTATHEEAVTALKDNWRRWLAWASLSEAEAPTNESPNEPEADSVERLASAIADSIHASNSER
jgi:hypothetical protein